MTALAAAGSLQQLTLTFIGSGRTALCITSWCAALRQLRQLKLEASDRGILRISSSLAGLTAATRLALTARAVFVDATVQLPPNLERLSWTDSSSAVLPRQVSTAWNMWGGWLMRHSNCTL